MNQIAKPSKIDPPRIDPRHYFESLVQQAAQCGLLAESTIHRIQIQLTALAAKQADTMLRGATASIRAETAQMLLDSIMFTIGAGLKAIGSADAADARIAEQPVQVLFEDGLRRVRELCAVARKLQKKILNTLFVTPNHFYKGTIADGINGFFKLYRPQFAAQEIHITADYPVFTGRPDADGIEFIHAYLRAIACENAFLLHFAPANVHHLILGVSQDYARCPINLFEPVLLSALGLILVGKPPRGLNLETADLRRLQAMLTGLDAQEIAGKLASAIEQLQTHFTFGAQTIQYIRTCVPKLADNVFQSIRLHAIEKCFVIPAVSDVRMEIISDFSERMADADFRKMIGALQWMEDSDHIIHTLIERVRSADDMIDAIAVLKLDAEQIKTLSNQLPLSLFAPLLIRYHSDAFLQEDWEHHLRAALIARMKTFDDAMQTQLRQMIRASRRSPEDA